MKQIMKLKPWPIIFFLSIALFIQNTCPFGAAGKTALSSLGKDCPLKHSMVVSNDMQKNLVQDSSTAHFPQFIFNVPLSIHYPQTASVIAERPMRAHGYKDALPDELLRPPRSYSTAA
jgi:hypothetical protein